jgi:hypothetical protein
MTPDTVFVVYNICLFEIFFFFFVMNNHSIKGAENQPETRSITDLLPTARKQTRNHMLTNKKPHANSIASQKTLTKEGAG